MNIRQLDAFRAVMQAGGVGRAAERLHVTQSAVSQLISQLEADIGVALFDRSSSRLRPTQEAEALLVEVEAVFSCLQRVDRMAVALREHQWGALRIASFPAIAHSLLPRSVARFSGLFEDVHFHLQSMRSRTAIDAVASRQIDLALTFLPGDREDVTSTQLQTLRAVCVLPVGHRLQDREVIHPEDLRGEAFVSLGPQDKSRALIDALFDARDIPRHIRIETGQSDAACVCVAEGVGVSIVDPISAWSNSGHDYVIRPFFPVIEFNIWLIEAKSAPRSALQNRFVEFLHADLLGAEYARLG